DEPGTHQYVRRGEVIRCSWHGWEFDIKTGTSWVDPKRIRVKRYPVTVQEVRLGVRDRGRGSNALGSPLVAAVHLMSLLAKQPWAKALQAGELVTTRSLTRILPIHAGEAWSTALDGIALPGISVTFDP